MNSTNVKKQVRLECGPESTIGTTDRDFDSTFDDSFILRTKPMQIDDESGFASANTFSFSEKEGKGGFDLGLGEKFGFKILEVKVRILN